MAKKKTTKKKVAKKTTKKIAKKVTKKVTKKAVSKRNPVGQRGSKPWSYGLKALVDLETISNGAVVMTIHTRDGRTWAKFRVSGGGNLLFRASNAVYKEQAGDADAFFHAQGMSDNEAFNGKTWT